MPRENITVLITAAGGKVGQRVVRQLVEKKVLVRAGIHSEAKASALRQSGIEAVVLDFESPESLAAAFNSS